MAELITPTSRLRASFLAAVAEFQADRNHPPAWFVADVDPSALDDAAAFEAYVERLRGERYEGGVRPGFVPMTTLWWADGDRMLGRLAIRHRLTPTLALDGGHIGYDVRPGARRQGHATAMLAAALPVARTLGIEEAVLTCAVWNAGSRRVIEANGGRYIDQVGEKLRFRVPTA